MATKDYEPVKSVFGCNNGTEGNSMKPEGEELSQGGEGINGMAGRTHYWDQYMDMGVHL